MIEAATFHAALIRSADVAIIGKDMDGIVVSWNPAAERLYGWSAGEMIGQSIRRLLPPDLQAEEDSVLARVRNGEQVAQFFTRRMHRSGQVLDVLVTVSPIRNAEGRIIGASNVGRDAGPILDQQRRLRESEERFRMLADNISQLAWIARADGHLTWYNKRWYDFTGTTLEEMEGAGWRTVHHPDEVNRVSERFSRAMEEGTDWEDTFPLRSAAGEYRWFLSRAMPIRDEAGQIIWWFGTNTDITEVRDQAEQIRLLLMEVNHRSKNLLATVQALARRTASGDAGFITRFEERLRSLAVNQDILVRRAWREVPLAELVSAQLAFLKSAPGEVTASGVNCALIPRAAEVVGMALHELATNSLKYGALSVASGRVEIGWNWVAGSEGFEMWWRESGGPPVAAPTANGFGTRLIRDVPRHNLGAEVALDFAPEGLSWTVRFADTALASICKRGG